MLALKKFSVILRGNAGLAQLVEQRIRNAWVGRSNLLTGTSFKKSTIKGAFFDICAFFYLQRVSSRVVWAVNVSVWAESAASNMRH